MPQPSVSTNNSLVLYHDLRCSTPQHVCKFGVVRMFLGFGLSSSDADMTDDMHWEVPRAELLDVSIPHHEDVNRRASESALRTAVLCVPGLTVRFETESLNAQLEELQDIVFGRAQHIAEPPWHIAKADKRLRRLMELLGVKAMTLSVWSWEAKGTVFALLRKILAGFGRKIAVPLTLRRLLAVAREAGQDSMIDKCMLDGLRKLSEWVRSPPDPDALKAKRMVAPLVDIAGNFVRAFDLMRRAGAAPLRESDLYEWRLGDKWPFLRDPNNHKAANDQGTHGAHDGGWDGAQGTGYRADIVPPSTSQIVGGWS